MRVLKIIITFVSLFSITQSTDITKLVFGSTRDVLPAAFGDFNSDELTDVFVIRNKHRTVEVMLAADEEPLLRKSNLKCNFTQMVTSIVPGDFDGDAFMDILVTTADSLSSRENSVHILWGGLNHLNCSDENKPILKIRGQPLAIDYDQNMIIDLFGVDTNKERTFWLFNNTRRLPFKIPVKDYQQSNHMRHPHSNAFLDINHDDRPDIFITGKEQFEIWLGQEDGSYKKEETWDISENRFEHVGQTIYVDIELKGRLEVLLPVCKDRYCSGSELLLRTGDQWHDLQLILRDPDGVQWRFVPPDPNKFYVDAMTIRSGDFNVDGYPDLLATFEADKKKPRAFLIENVPCGGFHRCGNKTTRTFSVRWDIAINTASKEKSVVAAAFYDFYQDGILDVLVAYEDGSVGAFKNGLDYDANFVKVMVLTGLSNGKSPPVVGRLGKRKRRTYGSNLPGPTVSYRTTTQEGDDQHGASAQLPQSAHNALGLPFNIFGLGRTPNFVDTLSVGLSGQSRTWTQIIPNSQMVVIPWPAKEPTKWRAQLFVTPSKLILMSVTALTGICVLITCIIGGLYWRERQEDRKERLQESHRFHFDAM